MTTERTRLSDHDIERFLQVRSAEPDPALWTDILTAAGTAPQRTRLWSGWTPGRRLVALLVVAVLLVAVGGAIGVGAGLIRPLPTTLPSSSGQALLFDRPFSYATRSDTGLALLVASPAVYRFEGSDRGVVVFAVRSDAVVHSCNDDSPDGTVRIGISGTPTQVIENLRVSGGMAIGAASGTTLDDRPALIADVDPSNHRCGSFADIHVIPGLSTEGTFVELNIPSRLILADVDGVVVGVLVWTESPNELDTWMPTAMEFVQTIQFSDR